VPLSVRLGFPVTWRAFRRFHSSVGHLDGVALEDRVATMGHADARVTLSYPVPDMEHRRVILQQILEPPDFAQKRAWECAVNAARRCPQSPVVVADWGAEVFSRATLRRRGW
jgi:hypothetical protein